MVTKIRSKRFIGSDENLFELVVDAPFVANKARGGNFIILRIDETGERIPLTVADYDQKKGTITMVVMAVGKTTTQLSKLKAGDEIIDFVGPLGNKAHIKKYDHPIVFVGGGAGIAPIYPQVKEMKDAGNYVITILGARTKDLLFWEDRFQELSDEVIITTDDGSYGRKGVVTVPLKEILQTQTIDHVVAIGPLIMMKYVVLTTSGKDGELPRVPTTVSLNTIMVDGTGMCGGCRFQTMTGDIKFACVDGPDVDGHDVDFDNLMERNSRFIDFEKKRLDEYHEQCRAIQKHKESMGEV
ncbi:MAG: sulfide/dihydroorotate dehydrogenase-like FAD/NAD-binding protein [Chloroflexota bacterium]|nr:sulfide/dihydroorotate dehydrogenase-like FAD/NAD-binding protein [Chloroflexota bacterium]